MKKEKSKILKEKYAGKFTGKGDKAKLEKAREETKKPDQPNLFGEQDQVYNTIQEEISIVVAAIVSAQEAISKKEDQVADLMERKQKLEKAAVTVAKLRDSKLGKKRKKKEKRKE